MYTYTFPQEHFISVISHMSGLNITVVNLALNDVTYTMSCQTQIESEQYIHMNEVFNLVEVI